MGYLSTSARINLQFTSRSAIRNKQKFCTA